MHKLHVFRANMALNLKNLSGALPLALPGLFPGPAVGLPVPP